MKPSFHHRPVNGPFEDPSLYVRFLWERRALIFDIGNISRLGPGDILRLTDVFVTHAHIDHFIGFDTVLRPLLRREMPLRVYGPENIIDCIEGKLRGYAWNLIEDYPLRIEAYGIGNSTMKHSSFYAEERFRRLDRPDVPFEGTALEDPSFRVKASSFTHDIQCIGYALEEEFHININKAVLADMGLPVGPWLSELKKAIRENAADEREFLIEGKPHTLRDLRCIATITKGQKVSYVMDIAPTDENIEKAIRLVRDSDTLYSEAYFLDEDRERAAERNHLTAKLAGFIAREAGVKNLVLLHFSPKYRHSSADLIGEAMREWKGTTP